MPYATSLWLSISTMIHQSQTVVPLLASSLTDKQLDSIQKNNSPFSDSSEGIQSELVYTVTIWKTQILWVRNVDLKVDQPLRKIQFMRKLFLNKRHKIIIQSKIEWYQLTTGVEEPLLAKPNKQIKYTSSVWFQDIIDFLYRHNIPIFTKEFLNIKSQRKNDK